MLRPGLMAGLSVGLVAVALSPACQAPEESAPVTGISPDPHLQRGLVFGLFARREAGYVAGNLDEIAALGANALSLPVPWVTPDVRSTAIFPREDMTPRDHSLRQSIRGAHRRGMSVLLMPIVFVGEADEGEWRGTLEPPDWSTWFRSYGAMLLHYAELAEEENVAVLSVGSELCSTERFAGEWTELIGRVRKVYSGALTYSSNWDHREGLSFVGLLDYVGMNSYFELSRDPDVEVEELVRAWLPIVEEVTAWRRKTGKPLLLTEVGYPSRRGTASNPWDYTREGPPDPEGQARAYRAFLEAWTGISELSGVYFYLWWGEGGPEDTGYTPRGKPAEQILRRWLGAATRETTIKDLKDKDQEAEP